MRRITKTPWSQKVLNRLIGLYVSVAGPEPRPSGISLAEIASLVRTSQVCRAITFNEDAPDHVVREIIEVAAFGAHPGRWQPSAMRWLTLRRRASTIGRILSDGDDLLTEAAQTQGILRVVGRDVQILADEVARGVVREAYSLASAPIDPYEDSTLILAARTAVADLLAGRPELAEEIYGILSSASSPTNPPGPDAPIALQLLAISIRRRKSDLGAAFIEAMSRLELPDAELDRFARYCDADLHRFVPAREAHEQPTWAAVATRLIRQVAPLAAGPAVAAGAGFLTWRLNWQPARLSVGIAEAIALLALLATVNVFAVQLSASRLPGLIARAAGQPRELATSYGSALTLLAFAMFPARVPWLVAPRSWAAVSAVGLFAGSLVVAMIRLLARTDAASAARSFVASRLVAYRAAGRRLGKYQAKALDVRGSLENIPTVSLDIGQPAGYRAETVVAPKRGLVVPRRRSLRRLLLDESFAHGMRLRIVGGLGVVQNRYAALAMLIPGVDQVVDRKLLRRCRMTFRVRGVQDVEEVSSAAVALASLSKDLARAGDTGTAAAVGHNLVRLLSAHVISARVARRKALRRSVVVAKMREDAHNFRAQVESSAALARQHDEQIAPVIPALRAAIQAVVSSWSTAPDIAGETGQETIASILSFSEPADAVVSILVASMPQDLGGRGVNGVAVLETVRLAAVRALETNDTNAWNQVLDWLESVRGAPVAAAQQLSVLAAIAARFSASASRAALTAFVKKSEQIGADNKTMARALGYWRVGGAALSSGVLSVAVQVARLAIDEQIHGVLIAGGKDRDLMAGERFKASIMGHYLGDSPEDTLAAFGRLLESMFQGTAEVASDS